MKFKKNDGVKIRQGVKVDGVELDVAGWHGRVDDFRDDGLIGIRLDSIVIRSLPKPYILETLRMTGSSEFNLFYLEENDLEPAAPRDQPEDVEEALDEIESKYEWEATDDGDGLGLLIQEVLNNGEFEDDLDNWEAYLDENVKFPFRAKVVESSGFSGFKHRDVITVKGIAEVDYDYGILVNVRNRLTPGIIPLCDLEFVEGDEESAMPIAAYIDWFVNR